MVLIKIILNISENCRLKCSYCGLGKRSSMMNFGLASKIVKIIKHQINYSQVELVFYGGEPLLNWRLLKETVELCEKTSSNVVVKYGLATSLEPCPPDLSGFLGEHGICTDVSIDVPTSGRRIFKKNRNDSWPIVWARLESLCHSQAKIFTNSVLQPSDLNHMEHWLDMLDTIPLMGSRLTADVTLKVTKESARQLILQSDMAAIGMAERIVAAIAKRKPLPSYFVNFGKFFTLPTRQNCGAGVTRFSISPDGIVYGCQNDGVQKTRPLGDALIYLDKVFNTNMPSKSCLSCLVQSRHQPVLDSHEYFSDIWQRSLCSASEKIKSNLYEMGYGSESLKYLGTQFLFDRNHDKIEKKRSWRIKNGEQI